MVSAISDYVTCSNIECSQTDETYTIEFWNTRPIEDALRAEVDALKRMMDMNPSNVTTCMGKPLGYWITLEQECDALREQLQETTHNLEIAESKLKVAMEAMKKAQAKNDYKLWQEVGVILFDALAEIEKMESKK